MSNAAEIIAIEELLLKYSHCYDDADIEGLRDVFTADSTYVIKGRVGAVPSSMDGRPAILAALQARKDALAGSQSRHFITNVVVSVLTDRTAEARSYLLNVRTMEGVVRLVGTGVYVDELRKAASGWRIHRRTLELDSQVA